MKDIGGTSQLFSGDHWVLCEGVNSFSTELDESGIKLRQFRIITASKSVNWMWTPRVIKMEKHLVMERIIAVKINNLTEKISLRILITRQPGELYLALGGKEEYIQNNVL